MAYPIYIILFASGKKSQILQIAKLKFDLLRMREMQK